MIQGFLKLVAVACLEHACSQGSLATMVSDAAFQGDLIPLNRGGKGTWIVSNDRFAGHLDIADFKGWVPDLVRFMFGRTELKFEVSLA